MSQNPIKPHAFDGIHRNSSSGKDYLELEVFTQRRVLNVRASPEENDPRFSIRVVCAKERVLALFTCEK